MATSKFRKWHVCLWLMGKCDRLPRVSRLQLFATQLASDPSSRRDFDDHTTNISGSAGLSYTTLQQCHTIYSRVRTGTAIKLDQNTKYQRNAFWSRLTQTNEKGQQDAVIPWTMDTIFTWRPSSSLETHAGTRRMKSTLSECALNSFASTSYSPLPSCRIW